MAGACRTNVATPANATACHLQMNGGNNARNALYSDPINVANPADPRPGQVRVMFRVTVEPVVRPSFRMKVSVLVSVLAPAVLVL